MMKKDLHFTNYDFRDINHRHYYCRILNTCDCDNCFAYCPEKENFTHCKFILNLAKHTEWENMN